MEEKKDTQTEKEKNQTPSRKPRGSAHRSLLDPAFPSFFRIERILKQKKQQMKKQQKQKQKQTLQSKDSPTIFLLP
jgi:hypothetical protein